MSNNPEEPKIIVDDDWKTQVQKEKEELENAPEDEGTQALPEASFGMLVTTLSTQTLAALGMIPDPVSGKATTNLPMAKHFIDTLGVLEQKTSGNLEDDEKQLLNETLHQLRMAFVMAGKATPGETGQSATNESSIELP